MDPESSEAGECVARNLLTAVNPTRSPNILECGGSATAFEMPALARSDRARSAGGAACFEESPWASRWIRLHGGPGETRACAARWRTRVAWAATEKRRRYMQTCRRTPHWAGRGFGLGRSAMRVDAGCALRAEADFHLWWRFALRRSIILPRSMMRRLALECGGLPLPLRSDSRTHSDWGLQLGVRRRW